MFRYKMLVIWLMICIVLPLLAFTAASPLSSTPGIPDTPDVRAITVTLTRYYALLDRGRIRLSN